MQTKDLHFKKALRAALFVLLLGAAGVTKGYAYDFSAVCSTGQTLYYNIIDATNHYVKLTYPAGSWGSNCWSGYDKPSGNIVLPDSVQFSLTKYRVTAIGNYAFYGCGGMTGNLVIPNSVTSIGNCAFYGCSGFTGSLTIGNSVTSIGDYAFYGCSFTGSLIIPNSVTSIGDWAFYGCSGFTGSLTIGNSVTSIGYSAFEDCGGFSGSLTIPNSVTSIDGSAFYNCSFNGLSIDMVNIPSGGYYDSWIDYIGGNISGSLTIGNSVITIGEGTFYNCSGFTGSLTLGNSVALIGEDAFYNCSGFTGSLTIPNSVTEIGDKSFKGCSGFTGSLTIPNSVTSIGDYAFYNCSGFTGSLTIPNSMTSIGSSVFSGCSGFTGSLTIPNSVTSIGGCAFDGCSGFTGSLTIGNSVTSIGNYAFDGCSGFTGSLTIPNSVTSIGYSAFYNCSGFTGSLTIPNSVTSIGYSAFYNCSGFTGSLIIPNSVTSIGNYAFSGCSSFTGSLTIPNSVTSIGFRTFENCSGFTGSLTISNSVTSIEGFTFYNCSGFTGSLTIPNFVTSIGRYAFSGCSGFIGSLNIPNSVTSIGDCAFYGCSGFTGSLTIPNSVTSIGSSAFSGCSGFGSLAIPDAVTSIYGYAFSDCSGLASMTVLANNPPVLYGNVFNNVDKTIPVYVPCDSIITYQNTSGWNEFTNYMPGTACDPGEITITANPTEGGSVTGAGYYEGGVTCTVTATANDGYTFLYWKEGGTIVSWDAAYSFFVCGDRNLEAVFSEGEVCNMIFDLFDSYGNGWTGNYLVVDYGNGSSERLTLGSGSSVSYSRPVETGSLVSLMWIEGTNSWKCFFDISFENGVPIYHGENLSSSFQYEFVFDCSAAYATYTISAVAAPEEGGTTEGAGEYDAGQTCTLTATPNRGYRFTEWTENGTQVSTETSYSFVVNRDRNLEAVFSEMIQPLLELEVDARLYPDSLDSNSPYVKVHWGCSLPDCEIVEDFETGDFSIYGWQTDSTYPWTITTNDPYEGNYCMKSGGAGVGNVVSNMTVMVYVPADGVMSFFGKISSENGWDYGYFYIDGVYKGNYTGTSTWFKNEFDITAGDHTFQWRYCKDYMVNMGDDCFYIDNITFYKQPEPAQPDWHTYCESEFNNAVGSSVGQENWAYEYPAAFLNANYAGWSITKVSLYSDNMYSAVGGNYTCRIYVGGSQPAAGTMVSIITVDVPQNMNAWVDWDLTTPVNVTGNDPIWVVWTANTKLSNWPAGCCGDQNDLGTWWDGGDGWEHQTYGVWTMRQWFTNHSGRSIAVENVAMNDNSINSTLRTYAKGDNSSNAICANSNAVKGVAIQSGNTRSFDHYSVYRANCDGSEMQLIAGDVTGNQYIDTEWSEMAQGHYKYGVSIGDSPNADIFWSNCIEKQGDVAVQTTALSKGWNWYSTYIEQEGIDGLGQLENSIGVPKAIIQSQSNGYIKSILRNGRILWGGALSSINNEEMYKIATKYICEATMEGLATDPASHPITINKGWNWIGFPCDQSVSVNVAISGFNPKNNDVIKGIHSYAVYKNGRWRGTLNTLEPGQGYMYGSGSNTPKTLVFQTDRGEATEANITPENNYYRPTADYADNMTLTAVVELDGVELRSNDYEVAAFVGDECRGSVKLMYVEPIDRYVAFLTVFGEQEEDLHFRLTDGIATSLSTDRLAYTIDGILGALDNPVVLHFGPMDVEENALADVKIYPNPSEGIFNIEGQNIRKVEVFNALGQPVYSKDAENDLMMIDLTNRAAGIYLIRIVTDNGIWSHQVMKR